ncbi:MAG: hypothetical protein WC260_01630 [Candidatus Pacearchaeota archaeon]
MNIFDYLNGMTEDKEELDFSNDEVSKGYRPYMINRYVSMIDVFSEFVNELNKYDLPKETHYNIYKSILPKRKLFFPYIKKTKDLNLEEKKYIANYFEVGLREAEQYINILSEDEIKEILKIYVYGTNSKVDM